MKTSFLSWSMVLVATALVACGDDTASSSGAGGEGGTDPTTTASTGGSPTTTTTTGGTPTSSSSGTPTSTSTGDGGGGSGGAPGDCTETEAINVVFDTQNSQQGVFLYAGGLDPVLVNADDLFRIELYDDGGKTFNGFEAGTFDLTENADENYATCSRCIRVLAIEGEEIATQYFQREGSITITSVDPETGVAEFSLDGVVLEEVEIDENFNSTPVAGGDCAALADSEYTAGPPELCDAGFSFGDEATDQCFEAQAGACDAFEACAGTGSDEDIDACIACINAGTGALCEDALDAIYESNCVTPDDTVWTCDDEQFWDGETCNCDCGDAIDPDCDNSEAPVEGCEGAEVCIEGGCVIPAENDVCADAIALVDGTVTGSTFGAANDYSPGTSGNDCTGFDATGPDVAYSFTLLPTETITIAATGDADLSVYIVTDCATSAATCQVGADEGVGGDGEILEFTSVLGGNFFLIVDQFGAAPADFELEVESTL